ncbi:MAG: DUF4292 domain-containing protein [Mediterranea sp.]|jgi:hypothetical protein|nr:DUF4292 domain-containing protein [Mediterranea sp.]
MKRIAYLLLLLVVLAGCRSSKHLLAPEAVEVPHYLSSRVQLSLASRKGPIVVNGTMKMKSGECVQIALLMPILRTEVARVEATPQQVLLVDRMNRRYVRASREELRTMFPIAHVEFARLQKLLDDAAKPGGKRELSGADLGIPALDGSKVMLYDFSTKELQVTPTALNERYRQIPLDEFVTMLKGMLR